MIGLDLFGAPLSADRERRTALLGWLQMLPGVTTRQYPFVGRLVACACSLLVNVCERSVL